MNIDNPIPVLFNHLWRYDYQESSQHDQVRIHPIYRFHELFVEDRPGFIVLRRYAKILDSMVPGSFQCIGLLIVTDHSDNLCIGNGSGFYGINDCLQICTASRYQHDHI